MNDQAPTEEPPRLELLLREVWTSLERAVADARHEWHLPVVATNGAEGMPQVRTVVLRGADPEATSGPELRFHTDARSGKVGELRADPRIGVLLYDRSDKVQVRIAGRAEVHVRDAVADEAWDRTPLSSRRCYLAPHAPSTTMDAWDPNLPEAWRRRVPDGPAAEAGRARFAAITIRVDSLERLELHHDGHQRSRWRWEGGTLVEATWLAP